MEDYQMILSAANRCYNEGLEKAKVRDLSGAIRILKEALRFYKYHTDARNLLGLCYYERGETVEALSEWVISKNLQETDNLADSYLAQVQTAGEMSRIHNLTTRYNQALNYCYEGSRDLARIQLKRAISLNSKNVQAYNLLALIQIQEGAYDDAYATLKKASAIDVGDTTTLRYRREVAELRAGQKKSDKRNKAKVISFQDGNDTVTMPRSSFRDLLDGSGVAVLNILIGLILGLLVCFFLIVPTVRQNARNDAANALVDANETATTNQNNINQLQAQISTLNAQLEQYVGQADLSSSYELLIQASTALNAGEMETAGNYLSTINRDLLGETGQTLYDTISEAVNAEKLLTAYNAGVAAYNEWQYEEAEANFVTVIELDPTYQEGQALYRLGQTYEALEQTEDAIAVYNQIQELFPDTSLANQAENRKNNLGVSTDATVTTGTTDTTETTEGTTITEQVVDPGVIVAQ